MPIPRTWSGSIDQTDLSPTIALPSTVFPAGGILPSRLGLPFINKSGSTLALGALVYVSGRDLTSGLASVSLADPASQGKRAQWIVQAATLNNAQGMLVLQQVLTGQNTNAGNVGDPVYLSATPGAYTLTNPAAAGTISQQVGNITVKAVSGSINLELLQNAVPVAISTNEIVPLSVTGALQSINAGARMAAKMMPDFGTVGTIPTTGAVQAVFRVPCTGTLAGVAFRSKDTLASGAGNDTNFITWAIRNFLSDGSGNVALLTTSPAGVNTTKLTGGSNGYPTAFAQVVLTPVPANTVAVGNTLVMTATITGTLAGTLTETEVELTFLPST